METNKENSSLKDGEKYGNCALCKEFEILKLSHRIPRAVGALIKKKFIF